MKRPVTNVAASVRQRQSAAPIRGQTVVFSRLKQQRTTVRGVAARKLDAIVRAKAPELSAAMPGFAAAATWPGGKNAQLPC